MQLVHFKSRIIGDNNKFFILVGNNNTFANNINGSENNPFPE